MDIRVEVNPACSDYRALVSLFVRSGWGWEEQYAEDHGEWWPKGSDDIIVVLAWSEENRLVGYARALTDQDSVTWLAEILVDPDCRKLGIGTRLMNEIVARTRHTAFYTNIFTGTEDFFKKFSLIPRPMLVAVSRKPMPEASP